MTPRDRLAALVLPDILAEIDDAGSTPEDWLGSEYVERLADRLIAAGITLATSIPPERPVLDTILDRSYSTPPPPPDALRAAAERLLALEPFDVHGEVAAWDDLRVALAATTPQAPAEAPLALDVHLVLDRSGQVMAVHSTKAEAELDAGIRRRRTSRLYTVESWHVLAAEPSLAALSQAEPRSEVEP